METAQQQAGGAENMGGSVQPGSGMFAGQAYAGQAQGGQILGGQAQGGQMPSGQMQSGQYSPTQGVAAGPGQGQAESGGLYRFVPGAGFVQVQGQTVQQAGQQAGGQAAQALSGQAQAGSYAAMGGQAQAGSYAAMGGQAQAGTYGASMGGQADQGASQTSGMFGQQRPEGAQPKFDQNKFGQMYGMIDDVMNGNVDPAKIFGFLESSGGDFWKGAIVGAAAVFLVNNEAVKGAVASMFGASAKKAVDAESQQPLNPSKNGE